jgi:hypothetical protein
MKKSKLNQAVSGIIDGARAEMMERIMRALI